MLFSFLYYYFNIAYLGSDHAESLRSMKAKHWVCEFTIKEYNVSCHDFNKRDEFDHPPFLLKYLF